MELNKNVNKNLGNIVRLKKDLFKSLDYDISYSNYVVTVKGQEYFCTCLYELNGWLNGYQVLEVRVNVLPVSSTHTKTFFLYKHEPNAYKFISED